MGPPKAGAGSCCSGLGILGYSETVGVGTDLPSNLCSDAELFLRTTANAAPCETELLSCLFPGLMPLSQGCATWKGVWDEPGDIYRINAAERQRLHSDFIRTISSVIEKTASLLYYPFLVKTITYPGWAVVISSAKLAERQGA